MDCFCLSQPTNHCLPQHCGWQKQRFKAEQLVWYIGLIGVSTGLKKEKKKHFGRNALSNVKLKQARGKQMFELAQVPHLVAVVLKGVGNYPEGTLSFRTISWAYSDPAWMIHTYTLSKMTIFIKSIWRTLCISETVEQAEIRTRLIKSGVVFIFFSFLLLFLFGGGLFPDVFCQSGWSVCKRRKANAIKTRSTVTTLTHKHIK